jgi:hypothetical protein
MIGAISLLMEAPAYPVSGRLADNLFEPWMRDDGALAAMLGPYLGVGPGRGMGLIRVLMGLCIALIGYANPRSWRVEEKLPDMLADVAETSPV